MVCASGALKCWGKEEHGAFKGGHAHLPRGRGIEGRG